MSELHRTAFLTALYERYLEDQNSAAFIKRVSQRYTVGTLQRLVHSQARETRRAAVLAIGFLGDYESNAVLGKALLDEDRTVRNLAENGIRALWRRSGNDAQRQQLSIVIRLNTSQQYGEAVQRASELIKAAPWLAEAWNQRAIALYNLRRYEEAVSDCHETLELNPYHFDAATGMGQCYLQTGKQFEALECLRRALRLNPDLEAVRTGIEYLKRSLKRR